MRSPIFLAIVALFILLYVLCVKTDEVETTGTKHRFPPLFIWSRIPKGFIGMTNELRPLRPRTRVGINFKAGIGYQRVITLVPTTPLTIAFGIPRGRGDNTLMMVSASFRVNPQRDPNLARAGIFGIGHVLHTASRVALDDDPTPAGLEQRIVQEAMPFVEKWGAVIEHFGIRPQTAGPVAVRPPIRAEPPPPATSGPGGTAVR